MRSEPKEYHCEEESLIIDIYVIFRKSIICFNIEITRRRKNLNEVDFSSIIEQ
jgi:hypothetical protein